jgi:hypothetical protein
MATWCISDWGLPPDSISPSLDVAKVLNHPTAVFRIIAHTDDAEQVEEKSGLQDCHPLLA